jgi:hypothetical protein
LHNGGCAPSGILKSKHEKIYVLLPKFLDARWTEFLLRDASVKSDATRLPKNTEKVEHMHEASGPILTGFRV